MATLFVRALRLEALASVARALPLVYRASPLGTVVLGVVTTFSAGLMLAVAWVGKSIMDAVVARDHGATWRWVLVEFGLVALQVLVQRGMALQRGLLGARLSLRTYLLILEKSLQLELRHFEDAQTYDRLTQARREASSRPVGIMIEMFHLLQNVLALLGCVALLLGFQPVLAVSLMAAAIPAAIVEARFSSAGFRMRNRRSPDARRLSYFEHLLSSDEHAKEVRVFGLGRLFLDRYRELGQRFTDEDRALAMRRMLWGYLLSLLGTSGFYACYLYIALLTARGQLTFGEMTLYVVAFRQGQTAFQSCLTAVGELYEHSLYLSNLFAFLTMSVEPSRPALQAPARAASATLTASSGEAGIRFEGVGFRYPQRDDWALRDVNLFVPRGQSLALVGHNGAGKTTLIKLLTRLYQPTEGRVLLDGRDLRDYPEDVLRARIGVVFQDFNQYQLSVRENIGVGNVARWRDEDRLRHAIEQAGASELVASLPAALETTLGSWFPGGLELSGGQWQRVALARAFMRREADILILDEPTSALDAEAEHEVFQRAWSLAAGRTTILISHRFATVRMASRILVLEGGTVLEEGGHDELRERGGRYAALFALQARGYQ